MQPSSPGPVSAMFGRIAGVYDFLNHFLSFGIDRYWRRELVSLVDGQAGQYVADLAAGTLDVSLALLKKYPDIYIMAIDFCLPMLQKGKKKLHGHSLSHIFPCDGNALKLPLADNSVNYITMAFGIRNISERIGAFTEMNRVLVPGGRVCILEFGSGKKKIWGGLFNFYLNFLLPKIGALTAKDKFAYSYLAKTIREFPAAEVLASEMREAGLVNVQWKELTSGIVCLHWGEKAQ